MIATLLFVRPGCESLELNEGHEVICFKGPPFLKPMTQFKANITTMTYLEQTILPGAKFELYLKGVEVSQHNFMLVLSLLTICGKISLL